jgi:hypothetical protein
MRAKILTTIPDRCILFLSLLYHYKKLPGPWKEDILNPKVMPKEYFSALGQKTKATSSKFVVRSH